MMNVTEELTVFSSPMHFHLTPGQMQQLLLKFPETLEILDNCYFKSTMLNVHKI
jgi:hypothetical protein